MNEPHDPSAEPRHIDLAAAAWLIKRDRGLTAAEQDEFLQWLAADARHGEWFARHQQTWKDLNALAQWQPEHSADPNPDLLARPARSRRAWRLPAGVALAAAALALAWLGLASREPAPTPETAAAARKLSPALGYESRVLDDGSIVELKRGAIVVADFTPAERGIRLVAGEAHFKVTKDARRPFVVRAGTVNVRAVGTAFGVCLNAASVEVLVTEGRVQVTPPVAAPAVSAAAELGAGERTVVSLAGEAAPPQVVAVSGEEIARRLSWQPQLFDFNATPLREVVAAFNRHNHVELVIGDPALANVPIVASFRSDNVDGFVRLLELSAGVRAERGERSIVLRRAR